MRYLKRRFLRTIVALLCVTLSVCGCGSLVKKFVREKKQEKPAQAMVLSPEVYPDSRANKEDNYRHYLALWSGWQDELIDGLSEQSASQRRTLESLQEAINNLEEMQKLFAPDKQAVVSRHVASLNVLKAAIAKDIYWINKQALLEQAESLKRQISGALQYEQIKDSLQ
jgi:hypothetical protein